MDPDPGGPKTYGSYGSGFASATLTGTINQSNLHPGSREMLEEALASIPRLVKYQIRGGRLFRSPDCMFPFRSPPVFIFIFMFILKVPSGQIRSAWEWYRYHWISLDKGINRCRFFKFWPPITRLHVSIQVSACFFNQCWIRDVYAGIRNFPSRIPVPMSPDPQQRI